MCEYEEVHMVLRTYVASQKSNRMRQKHETSVFIKEIEKILANPYYINQKNISVLSQKISKAFFSRLFKVKVSWSKKKTTKKHKSSVDKNFSLLPSNGYSN